MRKLGIAFATVVLIALTTPAFADGAADYKAKCQMCPEEKGLADSGASKAMKVKPVTDPEVQ